MPNFYINEAAFDLPELGFVDETIHVLRAKAIDDGDVSVLVFRSPVSEGKSLREVVASHHDAERRTLAGYAVLFEREIEVASSLVVESALRFRGEGGMMYQRNAHLLVPDHQHLLVAVNGPFEHSELCDRTMEHVLSTLQLRTD